MALPEHERCQRLATSSARFTVASKRLRVVRVHEQPTSVVALNRRSLMSNWVSTVAGAAITARHSCDYRFRVHHHRPLLRHQQRIERDFLDHRLAQHQVPDSGNHVGDRPWLV